MNEQYAIGVDPFKKGDRTGSAVVFKRLDEVVAAFKSRPKADFEAEARKMTGYFATHIIPETGLFATMPFYEPVYSITEDAEVISIETVNSGNSENSAPTRGFIGHTTP